ncbi:MAG: phospho-N-acetylmuramoyl-pentapeptide-transferase [Rickettsiales bacterium]|nr:phospho-N-acetylmuramoyl-pentapeptide-transferase [Rickettsiales bacterium]
MISIILLIKLFNRKRVYQTVRNNVIDAHALVKKNKPTMGGIVSVFSILLSALLFTNFDVYVIQALVISISFAIVGFIDDYIKVFKKNTNGFKGSIKIILQLVVCSIVVIWSSYVGMPFLDGNVMLPFNYLFKLGIFIGIYIVFVITGSANAVNLTDGLDGLAIIPIIFTMIAFIFIILFPNYFEPFNKENLSGILVLCCAVVGNGIAFFLFNKYPAKIFMGDVGSLFYGSLLGYVSIILKYEIFFAVAGLIFVLEAGSTIIQVFSHFLWGKRILKSAPLHHHFEKSGWSERKIILSFWTFYLICLLFAVYLFWYRPLSMCPIK